MTTTAVRVPLSRSDFARLPINEGEPLHAIAKKHLNYIARLYQLIKTSPHLGNQKTRFQLNFNNILKTWIKDYSDHLSVDSVVYEKTILRMIGRAMNGICILNTQESLSQMLKKDGYSSFKEVFSSQPVQSAVFAVDIRSAFHSGLSRLIPMLQNRTVSPTDVRDFRNTIQPMRQLLRSVPGNHKSFKQAAETEIVWQGYTLCSLAHEVSRFYEEPILPLELLEEPVPIRISDPLSPPEPVPTSPLTRDISSPL